MNVKSADTASTNKKHLQILATARDLFWKHGFRRVSIEEVCLQAGVSKMTFYRFFSNKIELAKEVLNREVAQAVQRFREVLAGDASPEEKIRRILLLKMEGAHHISREFLQDFYVDKELGLKKFLEEKTSQTWNEMLTDFRRAQENGVFRRDMKPEFLIYFSQKMTELITDEKLLAMYNSPQDLVMELTNFVSYGISPRASGEVT